MKRKMLRLLLALGMLIGGLLSLGVVSGD